MADVHSYTDDEIARVVLSGQDELEMLREIVVRAHGMATGRYSSAPPEKMRRQIGLVLEAAIRRSPVMSGFLGLPGGDASCDILTGSGALSGPAAVGPSAASSSGWRRFEPSREQGPLWLCAESWSGPRLCDRDRRAEWFFLDGSGMVHAAGEYPTACHDVIGPDKPKPGTVVASGGPE